MWCYIHALCHEYENMSQMSLFLGSVLVIKGQTELIGENVLTFFDARISIPIMRFVFSLTILSCVLIIRLIYICIQFPVQLYQNHKIDLYIDSIFICIRPSTAFPSLLRHHEGSASRRGIHKPLKLIVSQDIRTLALMTC